MAAKPQLQNGEGSSHWKSSTNITQPKFFKIILSQHERSRLRIPEDFASRYCKNMLNPVYLEVPTGEVWEVEVVHSQGQICLGIGWQDFSDFYSISCGHFLMFGYNARSHFNVTIFDLSASEIEYPYSSAHGIHTPISYSHETRHAPERDQSESDDSVEILEGIPRSQKANPIIPDMVENSVENLDHCPLGQSSKRQRQEGDTEDDVFVDMHIKRMKVEKLQEDVASFTREGQKSSEGCCTHMLQSKIVYDENKTVMDKERAIAYQRAKGFKSKNPFVISFMQPSYVFSPFNLSMSLKFARKYFLENYRNLVLRVPGRGSWSVKCTFGTTNAKIFWKAFVMDNKLKPGDVCVFEVIKGAKLLMDITIFPAAGSTPMHKIAGEVPWVSDKSVPFSQSRIVQTKNLKQRRGGVCGFNSKVKAEHGEGIGIEHSFEILGHCPLGQYRKITRLERDAEDDVPFDTHTKNIKVETSQEDVALPSFRKTKSRGSWSVECFMGTSKAQIRSGWKAFVLDNKLKHGDVCVFEVIKVTKLLMDVTIFPATGSTPMLKIAGEVTGVSDSKRKIIKTDIYVPCSPPKVVHTNRLKQRRGEEHDEGTGIESSVEILGHCPLGHDSKIKRLEVETEDDVSIDIHAKNIKVANTQEDVASPSFTRKTKNFEFLYEESGESCRMDKQQSKMVYDKNTTVLDKERTVAYQRAKDFKSENPYVMYFMQPSYVSTPYRLDITFLLARKYLWEKCGFLVLHVPGRGSWSVKYVLGKSKTKICFYWKAFVLDNKLKFGDVCVFELIKGTKPILDVTIFRTAESKPVHKIDGKLSGVSDCKNKTIKTENSVPCSQSKIVRSRKLNLEKRQNGNSDGFTSKTKEELSEDAGKHVQQSKSSCKGSAVAKEMVLAYQRAKAFTSENPFFICFMQPSYVSSASGPMQLSITLPIARKFFATKHSDVILQNSSKRSWAVKCSLGTVNAKLTSGWKEFVLDNDLKEGHICVFERVSRSKLLFNVIIFTSAEGM
ncbi:putative B3 domain-containing protein Os03g0621600 isoform X6 [Nicotiana sylvestris]|uniref:putative B3 domain-containing protein Os03g0621600 isoform X6 n=1 Tax=Nicotiana sylvestris TaxID=4096 RepID=UPI00388CBFAC